MGVDEVVFISAQARVRHTIQMMVSTVALYKGAPRKPQLTPSSTPI